MTVASAFRLRGAAATGAGGGGGSAGAGAKQRQGRRRRRSRGPAGVAPSGTRRQCCFSRTRGRSCGAAAAAAACACSLDQLAPGVELAALGWSACIVRIGTGELLDDVGSLMSSPAVMACSACRWQTGTVHAGHLRAAGGVLGGSRDRTRGRCCRAGRPCAAPPAPCAPRDRAGRHGFAAGNDRCRLGRFGRVARVAAGVAVAGVPSPSREPRAGADENGKDDDTRDDLRCCGTALGIPECFQRHHVPSPARKDGPRRVERHQGEADDCVGRQGGHSVRAGRAPARLCRRGFLPNPIPCGK